MKKSKFWHLSLFAFLVTGCSSLSTDKTALTQVSDSFPISSAIKALQEDVKTVESPWKEQVEAGISHLEKNELRKASTAFNTALGYKINDSAVQFLNGYTYHLIGLSGDNESFDLAAQGYDLSIKLDPSNWLARYQKGLLNLDRGNLDSAKLNFLDALIDQPNDIQILKKLIYSAYYTGDLEMAAAGNFQLCNLEPTGKHCLENRLLLAAALDAPDLGSQGLVENADASVISPERKSYLMERVASWQSIHSRIANAPEIGNVLTVSDTVEVEESSEGEATPVDDKDVSDSHNDNDVSPSDKARGNSEVFGSKMVITDVVIINSIEEATTSKGVNLLNSLTLQFGNTASSQAAFSIGRTETNTNGVISNTTSLVSALTIPAITYSLNIANAATTKNEILARPTLVGYEGQSSTFFSGNYLQAGAVSGGSDGSTLSLAEDIGVTLSVTPTKVTDELVDLNIEVSRTFITAPSTNVNFTYQVNQSKTSATSTVSMRRGDTLILSGLSEKETQKVRDGVPVLQDIPLVQYLFSNETTKDLNRSVMILVTPRLPEYVYLSTGTRKKLAAATDKTQQEVLNEFRGRYSDWFRPYPNWASTFNHLQDNSLYREFRTGDVGLEVWDTLENRTNRLNQAKQFLYF